jgi:hypothetical protein
MDRHSSLMNMEAEPSDNNPLHRSRVAASSAPPDICKVAPPQPARLEKLLPGSRGLYNPWEYPVARSNAHRLRGLFNRILSVLPPTTVVSKIPLIRGDRTDRIHFVRPPESRP